jgi:hypothetical protein
MAAYNKFNQFTLDLVNGVHDFDAHAFRVVLSLSDVPGPTDTILANITQIAAGAGYTAGGNPTPTGLTATTSTSGGTAKVVFADIVWTASGAMAGLRYATLYNDTPSSPADPLVAWWDYGSTVSLQTGETFTWDADPSAGVFTIL